MEWDGSDLEAVAAHAVEAATLLGWQLRRSGSGACAARLRLELCFGPRAACDVSPEEPRVPLRAARRLACSADVAEVGAASAMGQCSLGRASLDASSADLAIGSLGVRAGLVAVIITDVTSTLSSTHQHAHQTTAGSKVCSSPVRSPNS